MNILIVSDSYKGCLSSLDAGEAMAEGAREALPEAEVKVMAVSDGGDGMTAAFAAATGAQIVEAETHDPLFRPIKARYAMAADGTAYIELAASSGLSLLYDDERDALATTTLGTGELIADALRRGARRLVIGLGGSASTDAGMGLLAALGVKFTDAEGQKVKPCGEGLAQVEHIDASALQKELKGVEVIAACDVRNPLYGPIGAAYVFAPQKGATPAQVARLDKDLCHFSNVVQQLLSHDYAQTPGAGAAGGTGRALAAFMGASMESGISLLLKTPGMTAALSAADIIITGEGRMDSQTSMGKAAWGILQEARRRHKKIYAVAGRVVNRKRAIEAGFTDAVSATPRVMPMHAALNPATAKANIARATAMMLRGK